MEENKRMYYIDNLRWACILLLVPFHAAMAFNSWEGNYIWFEENVGLSTFVMMISPWYMSLLFVLAGISTRLSLRRRSSKQFVKERIQKLLLPLITGMVTVVAGMTYYADRFNNGYTGNFVSHYIPFFTTATDLTGYDGAWTPGHLWFILYLFIISMLCFLVIQMQKRYAPKLSFAKMNPVLFTSLGLLPLLVSPILNFGGKSIASFIVLYLIGYYLITEESIRSNIVKYRYIYLILLLITDITDAYMYVWMEHANGILNTVMMYLACWFGVLTMIGFGQKYFDWNNKVTRYFTSRSFLFYIFHFFWLVVIQFYLGRLISNPGILFTLSALLTYLVTFLNCEIVIKIPVIRYLFGMKYKK